MRVAVSYYRMNGEAASVINERFRVIDEVRNARELFNQLNETLSAPWETMYGLAKQYYEENGNLEVPRRYKTPDGYSLGSWIFTQRRVYAGEQYGCLDDDRIKKLEAIGMIWDSVRDLSWQRYYSAAEKYFRKHGNLNVKVTTVTEDGLRLGEWISNLRTRRKNGAQQAYLTPERIEALDRIGMVWDVPDYLWEENYLACMEYYREHGDLDVPARYCSPNGLQIGAWIRKLRLVRRGKAVGASLTDEQIARLDRIGMIWSGKYEKAWQEGYAAAKRYYAENGNLNVPTSYYTPDGFRLGGWICDQRERGRDKLSPERVRLLDDIEMIWQKPDSWEIRYALAKAYYDSHGNLNVPPKYKSEGIWLSKWLNEQRQIRLGKRPGKSLAEEQIARLDAIGMCWENRNMSAWNTAWEKRYDEARQYYLKYGSLNLPTEAIPSGSAGEQADRLSRWLTVQRKKRREGKLTAEQIRLLDELGMAWSFEDAWEVGYEHAKQHAARYGSCNAPGKYIAPDGYGLGTWIANQRNSYNNPTRWHELTDKQIKALEELGMVWSPNEEAWKRGYRHALSYYEKHGDVVIPATYVTPDGYKLGEWVRSQRRQSAKGQLREDRRGLLTAIGIG
jgi:hypothetical protein